MLIIFIRFFCNTLYIIYFTTYTVTADLYVTRNYLSVIMLRLVLNRSTSCGTFQVVIRSFSLARSVFLEFNASVQKSYGNSDIIAKNILKFIHKKLFNGLLNVFRVNEKQNFSLL